MGFPIFDRKTFFGLLPREFKKLKSINTPARVQDFVDSLPINFEEKGETYMSVQRTLREGKAHCLEGALVAACAFWIAGQKPLLLDLKTEKDEDHVVALFRENGYWGAVSKTNHAVLRYRDPIYRTTRELALSYFHEYFKADGVKTLRAYSRPFSLLRYEGEEWISGQKDLFEIAEDIDNFPHYELLNARAKKSVRRAEPFVRETLERTEWRKPA